MGLKIIGDCAVCGRACSTLEIDSLLCQNCLKNPEQARERRFKRRLYAMFWWAVTAGIIFTLGSLVSQRTLANIGLLLLLAAGVLLLAAWTK